MCGKVADPLGVERGEGRRRRMLACATPTGGLRGQVTSSVVWKDRRGLQREGPGHWTFPRAEVGVLRKRTC